MPSKAKRQVIKVPLGLSKRIANLEMDLPVAQPVIVSKRFAKLDLDETPRLKPKSASTASATPVRATLATDIFSDNDILFLLEDLFGERVSLPQKRVKLSSLDRVRIAEGTWSELEEIVRHLPRPSSDWSSDEKVIVMAYLLVRKYEMGDNGESEDFDPELDDEIDRAWPTDTPRAAGDSLMGVFWIALDGFLQDLDESGRLNARGELRSFGVLHGETLNPSGADDAPDLWELVHNQP